MHVLALSPDDLSTKRPCPCGSRPANLLEALPRRKWQETPLDLYIRKTYHHSPITKPNKPTYSGSLLISLRTQLNLSKPLRAPTKVRLPYPSRDHQHFLNLDHQTSHPICNRISKMSAPAATSFFRVTLMRSAIGLPRKSSGVLKALGLHKRLRTVYHPVTPDVAGQIFAVKELVDVQEVDQKLTHGEMKELRKPDTGFWVEKKASELRR